MGNLRQLSSGFVKLRDRSPFSHPIIQPNLCENEQDLDDMVRSVELTLEIFGSKVWDGYKSSPINFTAEDMSCRQNIKRWLRSNIQSSYHASCTLPMGSITDPTGKLIGIENLRVVDASIMPSMVSGNLNATVVMIAEKISHEMLGGKEEGAKS